MEEPIIPKSVSKDVRRFVAPNGESKSDISGYIYSVFSGNRNEGIKFKKDEQKLYGIANNSISLYSKKETALIHVNNGSALPIYNNNFRSIPALDILQIPTQRKKRIHMTIMENIRNESLCV